MRHHDAFTTWEVEAERRREVLLPDHRQLIDDAIDRAAPTRRHRAIVASTRWVAGHHPASSDAMAAGPASMMLASAATAVGECRHAMDPGAVRARA